MRAAPSVSSVAAEQGTAHCLGVGHPPIDHNLDGPGEQGRATSRGHARARSADLQSQGSGDAWRCW